jgi:hypothetical protein
MTRTGKAEDAHELKAVTVVLQITGNAFSEPFSKAREDKIRKKAIKIANVVRATVDKLTDSLDPPETKQYLDVVRILSPRELSACLLRRKFLAFHERS